MRLPTPIDYQCDPACCILPTKGGIYISDDRGHINKMETTGQMVKAFHNPYMSLRDVYCMVESDGLLWTSMSGPLIVAWDIKTRNDVKGLQIGSVVRSMFARDGYIYMADYLILKIYSIAHDAIVYESNGVVYNPDAIIMWGSHFCYGELTGSIKIAKPYTESMGKDGDFEIVATFTGHNYTVSCLALQGPFLFSGSHGGSIKKWDSNGTCLQTLNFAEKVVGMCFIQSNLWVCLDDPDYFVLLEYDLNRRPEDRIIYKLPILLGHFHFVVWNGALVTLSSIESGEYFGKKIKKVHGEPSKTISRRTYFNTWSPSNHGEFAKIERDAIKTLILLHRAHPLISGVPMDIMYEIFRFYVTR